MRRSLRKAVFWVHLAVGTLVGLVIAVMAATGTVLAFREQVLHRAERSARVVVAPDHAARLEVKAILEAVRDGRPEARASQITLKRDPASAVEVSLGKTDVVFVNPYTGELLPGANPGLREFFEKAEGVHRWLGLSGRGKQVGLALTSACCAAYAFLLASGLYLWFPTKRDLAAFVAAMRPRSDLRGKARDWNWHTTVGFWASPLLLATTVTGLVMAYPSLADHLYKRQAPGLPAASETPASAPVGHPLPLDALIAKVGAAYPQWDSMGIRIGGRRGGDNETSQAGGGRPGFRPAVSFSVKDRGAWPAWTIQLSVDPYTGAVTTREDPAHEPFMRVLRTSARALHTGEAGGSFGQSLVAIGALATLAMIATGFSLLVRRIRAWRSQRETKSADRPKPQDV